MDKEKIGLAKEHIRLAEQLVSEESEDPKDKNTEKELLEAQFALEKAESEIEDLEEIKD